MTREERIEKIKRLCSHAGCSDKIRKVHFSQFVDHQWHPHPPERFVRWFAGQPDKIEHPEMSATVAFNAACYYDKYCEEKELGLA
jgi:hypothetical protein